MGRAFTAPSAWATGAGAAVLLALFLGCGGPPGEREFKAGVKEIGRGNYVSGKNLLEKSINRRPGSPLNADAYNYVGYAAWKLGQVQPAIEAFEESRRLDPKRAEPAYNLAVLLFESGEATRAEVLLEQAALADPADPRALEFLGAIHAKAGRWPEARRSLFAALARAPKSARILTALAVVENHTGGADKAIFYLMQALDRQPDYAPALFNLGLLYRQDLKDDRQSQAYFRKYLEVAGDDPHAAAAREMLEEMTPAPPVAAPAPAQPPAAALAPAPAEPSAPPPAEAKPKTVEDLLREGQAEYEKGRVQVALNLCLEAAGKAGRAGDHELEEKALRIGAKLCFDQPRAHYALGRFLLDRGRADAAVQAFKQAILLDPKFALGHMGLAEAAIQAGEFDAALVSLKQAVQLEPNNADALWALASFYDEQLGVSGKATQAYREFVKRFPGDPRVLKANERLGVKAPVPQAKRPPPPPATPPPAAPSPAARKLEIPKPLIRNVHAAVQAYNRGTQYQQRQDWDRAIYYYTRAVENDATFATAYFNLGAVYSAKGDYDLARDAYRQAIELQPEMISARYNLALVLKELKNKPAAIEELQVVLQKRPDYAPAHYLIGWMYAEDAGTHEQAKAHYRKFLELSPSDPSAPAVKDWLSKH